MKIAFNEELYDYQKKGLLFEIKNQAVTLKETKNSPGIVVGKVKLNGLECLPIRLGSEGTAWPETKQPEIELDDSFNLKPAA